MILEKSIPTKIAESKTGGYTLKGCTHQMNSKSRIEIADSCVVIPPEIWYNKSNNLSQERIDLACNENREKEHGEHYEDRRRNGFVQGLPELA